MRLIDRLRRRRTDHPATALPSGTVTFVLTDVESSTRLWEAEPDAMRRAIVRHTEIIADAVARRGGTLVRERGEGDSTFSVFTSAPLALAAVFDFERALVSEPWPEGVELRVRAALHTGDAQVADDEYVAPAINRCARIREVAYGGQVLLSEQTAELAEPELPAGSRLQDLGPHRLRDLARPMRLYQLHHPDLPEDFPAPRSLDAVLHNLPVQLTSFIGRDREINEVRKHLAATRILNLTGPGGVGKTRLALQAAGDLIETYTDGIWFVDLSPLRDGDLIPQAVSSALSLREEPGRPVADTVLDHLRGAKALVIFDNCEHLSEATTLYASNLLRSCVELTVLATGREPLRVPGATTWTVPPMSAPGDDFAPTEDLASYEAVRLFCERAAQARPDFALTHQTGPTVARICRRLDGVPLAIELAAAAMRSLSAAEIDARLDDRFRILTGGGPDTPRHETLRATVDWSHELLSPKEQMLLRRLSVFAGGFTLEGAEEVCAGDGIEGAEVVELVAKLVDKSLVVPVEFEDVGRYALLETIREYAADKLEEAGEDEALRGRHFGYFRNFAANLSFKLNGPDEAAVLGAVQTEHDNLRKALRFGVDNDSESVLSMAPLGDFWSIRGMWSEGRAWLSEMLRLGGEGASADRARALAADASLAEHQGNLTNAREGLEEALRMFRTLGDDGGESRALLRLGMVVHSLGERSEASSLVDRSLEIARSMRDGVGEFSALNALGVIALSAGEIPKSIEIYQECVGLAHRIGVRRLLAGPLLNLGHALLNTGDSDGARTRFEEALQIAREVNDQSVSASSLSALGDVAQRAEDYESAQGLYAESLEINRQLGDRSRIGDGQYRLGFLARVMGRSAEARARLTEALDLFEQVELKQGIAAVLHEMGCIDRVDGNVEAAEERLRQSMGIARELRFLPGVASCLDSLAGIAIDRSDAIRAAQLLGAADAIRETTGASRSPAAAADVDTDARAGASIVGRETFERARIEGRELGFEHV